MSTSIRRLLTLYTKCRGLGGSSAAVGAGVEHESSLLAASIRAESADTADLSIANSRSRRSLATALAVGTSTSRDLTTTCVDAVEGVAWAAGVAGPCEAGDAFLDVAAAAADARVMRRVRGPLTFSG